MAQGRVRKHIHLLAILWLVNGVLRLMGVAWLMLFGSTFLPWLRGRIGADAWPLGPGWGLDSFLSSGFFSLGIFLGLFGLLDLALAWGLFERQSWARILGLALAILALLRFPFGTALGIYTLWVLAPEPSVREYQQLSRSGGRGNRRSGVGSGSALKRNLGIPPSSLRDYPPDATCCCGALASARRDSA